MFQCMKDCFEAWSFFFLCWFLASCLLCNAKMEKNMQIQLFIRRLLYLLFASFLLSWFFFLCIRMWYHGSTERGDRNLLSLSHILYMCFFSWISRACMLLHVTDYVSWLLIDPSGQAESVFCVQFRNSSILNSTFSQQAQHLSTRILLAFALLH